MTTTVNVEIAFVPAGKEARVYYRYPDGREQEIGRADSRNPFPSLVAHDGAEIVVREVAKAEG